MAKVPDSNTALVKNKNNVSSLASSMFAKLRSPKSQNSTSVLQSVLAASSNYLFGQQHQDGHWIFDLEADVTIPSEYIFLQKFLGKSNPSRESQIAKYLLVKQNNNGSWPLYHDGPGNVSATVKAYFALKLLGYSVDSDFMVRAKTWVLENGGAETVNVFTRITLAMFGQLNWKTVPAMPVEIMYLPNWWFFNLNRVSYWSRCVIVPLLIIFAKKPVVELEQEFSILELFHSDPRKIKKLDFFRTKQPLKNGFILLDRILKLAEPFVPKFIRNRALKLAESWLRKHSKGSGGIGAIFPAISNAIVSYKLLGSSDNDEDMNRQINAMEDLIIEGSDTTYCQPCVSPIWDTCLTISALSESGVPTDDPRIRNSVNWLLNKQVFVNGDWSIHAPRLKPGGWAFQYENDKYPDVDDTGMVLMGLLRAGAHLSDESARKGIKLGLDWIIGMQNPDGSWGAFDIGNNSDYLNNIPFADHGALVDPGTADLTARCIELLAMVGYEKSCPIIQNALSFLKREQEQTGAWYGRWGVNYIYGTWSVLAGLGAIKEDYSAAYVQKAVKWLKQNQNDDGGWGESCSSYDDDSIAGYGESTASQTAWALLGLLSVGEYKSSAVENGVNFLIKTQNSKGGWDEKYFTGTGFPKVFYLRYHGYAQYFPLWALSVYQRCCLNIETRQNEVMDATSGELRKLLNH